MDHSYTVQPGATMASVTSRPHPVLPMMEIKMSETDAVESFPAMLRRVLGNRLRSDAETFPDMFAVDGVLEYPYAPPGLNTPIAGRDAIIANFQRIRKLLRIDRGGRLRRDTVSLWLSGVPAGCYRVVPLVGRCAGRA